MHLMRTFVENTVIKDQRGQILQADAKSTLSLIIGTAPCALTCPAPLRRAAPHRTAPHLTSPHLA